jgi:hypothetical protein
MDSMPAVFKVTFKEHFPLEVVNRIWETDFVGLGTAYRRGDPRLLYVIPTSQNYPDLRKQLEQMQRDGALSFTEETGD